MMRSNFFAILCITYCIVVNAAPDIATLAYRDDLSDTERLHWYKHYQEQRENLATAAVTSLRGTQQQDVASQWHTLRVAWDESVMRVITLSVGTTLTAYPNASQSDVDFLIRKLKTNSFDVSVLFAAAPQQIRLDVATADRWRGIPLDGGDATWTLVRIDNTQRELTVVTRITYNCCDDISSGFDSHAMSWIAAPWMTAELDIVGELLAPRLFRCVLVAPATLEVTAIFTKPSLTPDTPLALSVVFPSVLRRLSRMLHSD